MNKKKLLISSTAMTGVLLTVLILGMVVADTDDSATGSFGLNAPPVVSGVQVVDASYALSNTLTPDDTTVFGVNTTVQHSSEIAWIKNVTWYIFDDSVHGSDWASADPDGIQLTAITWTEVSDTWSVDQGAMTEWNINSPVDPGSSYAGLTYDFVCRFQISRVARYDTDWNVTVKAFDDDVVPETDEAAETGLVTMNKNFEISFSSATFSWGADIQPSSTNNTHDALSLQIYGNANWELRLNATDFAPNTVDIEAQNILAWDEDGSNGDTSFWVRNTIQTALGTWDAQAPMSDESGFTRTCYFFLSPGVYFTTGETHSTVVRAYIQADV